MSLSPKSKRITIANLVAILIAALLMWVYTSRGAKKRAEAEELQEITKVGVDLSPDGLRVDSLGYTTGKQKHLLGLLLPNKNIKLVPFSTRSEAIKALQEGQVQVYATTMPLSMAKTIEGTTPTEWLYTSSFSILYNKLSPHPLTSDEPITVTASREDLGAITILQNLAELNYPNMKVQESNSSPLELGVQLSKGEIKYLMCDHHLATAIVVADSTLMISDEMGFQLQQVWLVNSNMKALKATLDSAIVANRGSAEWLKIIDDK